MASRILISPSGGKSRIDYLREAKETDNFTKPGRWSGGTGSQALQVGDMFAFVDADKQMMIFPIINIWIKNLDQYVRPWWQIGAYKIKTVIEYGPMMYLGDMRKYNTFHDLKEKTPSVGRAVHEWRPAFLADCVPFDRPISIIADEKNIKTTETKGVEGWVYFIGEEPNSGWVKIGCTRNKPEDRVAELQTGNPRRLVLLNSVTCMDYKKFEAYLHKCFDTKRGVGEWFQLTANEINELVKFLAC